MRVVLPASGWVMMAKVRRRAASAAGEGIPARVPGGPKVPDRGRVTRSDATCRGRGGPDRTGRLSSSGLELAVNEWGDADAPILALVHGGFDFSRTFDVFAPMLADAGWRVVAWDARGHGDSEHAQLYSWAADVRDHFAVLTALSDRPVCVLGHSKGGGQMLDLLDARPDLARAFVNLDGLPSSHSAPDITDRERMRMRRADVESSLDRRRRRDELQRRPDTIEGLAERRAPMNPRPLA